MQIVAADVGNSSIKLSQGSLDREKRCFRPVHDECLVFDPQSLSNKLSLMDVGTTYDFHAKKFHWYVSSVSPANAAVLQELAQLSDSLASWTEIVHDSISLKIDVEKPDAVGIDRLLAADAAKSKYAADRDAIVVDCGTALTIDLVTRDNTFRGGVIIAGPATSLPPLASMTASLPDFSAEQIIRPDSIVGRSTHDAMLAGAWANGLGTIREVIKRISETLDDEPVVVGTGGGLGPWQDELPESWIIVENLVIEGLFQIALADTAE